MAQRLLQDPNGDFVQPYVVAVLFGGSYFEDTPQDNISAFNKCQYLNSYPNIVWKILSQDPLTNVFFPPDGHTQKSRHLEFW